LFLRPSAHRISFVLWRTALQIRFSAEQLKSALARGSFDFLFLFRFEPELARFNLFKNALSPQTGSHK